MAPVDGELCEARAMKHSLHINGHVTGVILLLCFGCSSQSDDFASAETAELGTGARRILYDDFRNGFDADSGTGKWALFAAEPFVADDGIVRTGPAGLVVTAPGTNPQTGEPAFTKTVAPESQSNLPGDLDQAKWLAYTSHTASSGFSGFDTAWGRETACEAVMGGETFGTQGHPFGADVENANDDLRLAAAAMLTIDPETFMVFDFFITNRTLYAFYERLPFARTATDNYASFSYAVPVLASPPGRQHSLKIAYDKRSNVIRWLVNQREVFRVTRPGRRISRQFMLLDHGGDERDISLNQLNCGMGMLTLLDAHLRGRGGLARLSEAPEFYYNPEVGSPVPQTFSDERSQLGSRLFGQGAKLRVQKYFVSNVRSVSPG